MSLVCLSLSHHNSPVEIREKFSFSEQAMREAHDIFGQISGGEGELVLLSTCNRIEIYAAGPTQQEVGAWINSLFDLTGRAGNMKDAEFLRFEDGAAVRHLFKVASGLESMVVGETEIFGQVKKAYALANGCGRAGKLLHRFFQTAFRVGKKVRSETEITRGGTSVGATAAELAEHIFGNLSRCHVLLVGASDTGEKTARALLLRGVSAITVTNRTHEKAAALASEWKGRTVLFEGWFAELLQADIVVSATSAQETILPLHEARPFLAQRGPRPIFMIDLAVPRDLDPALGAEPDVYLYNMDDLQTITEQNKKDRRQAMLAAEAILDAAVKDFVSWQANSSNWNKEKNR